MTDWKSIPDFLADLRGERIYYRPNPGNGGDGLIAEATYQLFDRLELDYKILKDDQDIENAVIVFGGGGNLIPSYTDAVGFFARHHARARRLVLLPHTVDGHEELLGKLGSNVDIFCREHRSYEHVTRFAPGANVHMGEDMALSLDLKRLHGDFPRSSAEPLKNRKLARQTRSLRRRLGYSTWLADLRIRRGLAANRVAYCFRKDVEQTEVKRPFGNFDLSHRTPIDRQMLARAEVIHGCREFMKYLGEFDRIETNRLHVAVGSALLGKEVILYPNSYWKNRAVFEASLRHRFETLEWAEPFPDAEIHAEPGRQPGEQSPQAAELRETAFGQNAGDKPRGSGVRSDQ